MRSRAIVVSLSLLFSSLVLTGCSTSFAPGPVEPVQTAFGNIGGYAYGGQQPIIGATVEALQTSTTAYGGASTVLATTTTSAESNNNPATEGYFTFPASTTCTSGTVVYLYSVGGNPGGGVNNAAGELAVLGTCPAGGLLDESISGGSTSVPVQIYMNEVSTVAAAYALAGFAINSANVSTDALHIGANIGTISGTTLTVTDALAQTGLENAAANAAQMYTDVATSDGGGLNNGSTRAALATTPGGNGTVPQKLIDTIANILAACINSTVNGACTTLFNDDTSTGGQGGTKPTDTATAAIYLAQHPYSAYVTTLYNIIGSTANPFTPALNAAPTTFVVELEFSGGGLDNANYPNIIQDVAIDGSGNVWTANDYGATVGKFNPLGVSLAGTTGYSPSGCGLAEFTPPVSIAINAASTQAWVGVEEKNDVCVLTSAGAYVADTNIYASGDGPYGIAFDSSGTAWATNATGAEDGEAGQLIQVSGTSPYSVLNTFTGNGLNYPLGIAIEPGGGDIWVGNVDEEDNGVQDYDSVFTSTGAAASYSPVQGSDNIVKGAGVAIDASGNIWTASSNTPPMSGLAKTSEGCASATCTTNFYAIAQANTTTALAIDGAGNVWSTSAYMYDAMYEQTNSGTQLLPAAGYVPLTDASGAASPAPLSVAIDGSGNVWYTLAETNSSGTSPLRELVGAAVPVATPIAYGVANNLLGARP